MTAQLVPQTFLRDHARLTVLPARRLSESVPRQGASQCRSVNLSNRVSASIPTAASHLLVVLEMATFPAFHLQARQAVATVQPCHPRRVLPCRHTVATPIQSSARPLDLAAVDAVASDETTPHMSLLRWDLDVDQVRGEAVEAVHPTMAVRQVDLAVDTTVAQHLSVDQQTAHQPLIHALSASTPLPAYSPRRAPPRPISMTSRPLFQAARSKRTSLTQAA